MHREEAYTKVEHLSIQITMAVAKEMQIQAEAWDHILCYIKPTALVAIVELEIPDVLEKHGGPMSHSDLSAAIGCSTDNDRLFRLMRFLIFYGIFKKTESNGALYYEQTPLSRFYTKEKIGAFAMLQGTPRSRLPAGLTGDVIKTGTPNYLKSVKGEDSWSSPAYGYHRKVFTEAMEAHARVTTEGLINNAPAAFEGIGEFVDVGGRHGLALSKLMEVFPWIRGTAFDLPEVVAKAPPRKGIEFVGGSMFDSVPKGDAVMLMWILHDWSDKACIDVLKKCKEAIPTTGKVMIVDAIIDEDGEGDEFSGARLAMDMVMMAVMAQGKERTYGEWAYLLKEAGFSRHTVTNIKAIESLIEAYP